MKGNIVKNIILLAVLSLTVLSCLKGGGSQYSYQAVVDFEEFQESADGSVYGEDSVYFKNPVISYDLGFDNRRNEDKTDYTGFAISIAAQKKDGPYRVNAEAASSGKVYAVFHDNPDIEVDEDFHHIVFIRSAYGTCTPVYCMINNTKTVADSIRAYNDRHEDPLEMKLTVKGYYAGEETGSAEILLSSSQASKVSPTDSIVSAWTVLGLQKLGNVEYVDFDITFSDEAQTTVPKYFCMDNFGANVYVAY